MIPREFPRWAARPAVLGIVLAAFSGPSAALAGKAVLKNGTSLEGELIPIKGLTPALIRRTSGPVESFPIIMVHAWYKRYFVPRSKVDFANSDEAPGFPYETFEIKRKPTRRKPIPPMLGATKVLTPWTKFGRRTVQVLPAWRNDDGRIVEGITRLTPKYIQVQGITHDWKHGLAVTSFRPNVLDAILTNTIDAKKASDRMGVVRFYIQAGMYDAASRKLAALEKDFPELKKKAEETRYELRQLQADQIINELRRRKKAGQHRLVYRSCGVFPREEITAAVLREVRLLKKEYDDARSAAERDLMLLADLQARLKDPKILKAVKPMRSEVRERLDFDSLPRLDAFARLSADPDLKTQQKLALAYSGWVMGSGRAIDELDVTIRLWEARFLMMEYLREGNPLKRKRIVEQIKGLEGVRPEYLGYMVPYLPPVIETPEVRPGRPHVVQVAGREGKPPLKYAVMLPPEYSPHHVYPAIVALRPRERPIETELEWWAGTVKKPGQAQRHGYVVIVPEYMQGKNIAYDYSSRAHAAVIECLRDARKRFSIDSDRVYLSGHGSGGDAAFDIGMSHPDLFAGAMPLVAVMDKYCPFYYLNAKHLPWYIVSGERARNSLERNARELTRMMTKSPVFDVIYAEYLGRGYESYYEEIHSLFDWMPLHRRRKHPKRIEARVLRTSDDRFWWVKAEGFPNNVSNANVFVKGVPRTPPMPLEAWVSAGNNIHIRSGAMLHTVWLAPDFIDYSKRVEVRLVGFGRRVFNGFLSREIDTMLEDLRVRGDRQKLYWTRLDVSRTLRKP